MAVIMEGVKSKSQKTYEAYADIYDTLKGDRSETIHLLRDLIEEYRPDARVVLDLACGTGSIAAGLAGPFNIVGLDKSPRMLRHARRKLPHFQFIEADMTRFALGQVFDVIYCLHNSMNHVLTFQEWEKTFTNVAAHLSAGGIFIFDVNPPAKMDGLVRYSPSVKAIGEDYVITEVTQDAIQAERYHWHVKMLLKQKRSTYSLQEEVIPVSTYPLEHVRQALTEHFRVVKQLILQQECTPDDTGRAYFVCIKK